MRFYAIQTFLPYGAGASASPHFALSVAKDLAFQRKANARILRFAQND